MIDLHIHTSCSDGQFSPEETIRMAAEAGVTIAAITDHDTTAGISAAAQAASRYGIQFFAGIEISVQGSKELHILGYGIDASHPALLAFCQKNAQNRELRCDRMLTYLQQCGAPITLEEVKQYNNGRTTGRPHFARALVEKGYAASIQDAFDRYLTTDKFYATVERPKPSPEEGIQVIRDAGGVAVLAHPYQLQLESDALQLLLEKLKGMGLRGIEAYYSRHTPQQMQAYAAMAQAHQLLVTCGSDFHGSQVKPDIHLGTGISNNLCISNPEIIEQFREAVRENH